MLLNKFPKFLIDTSDSTILFALRFLVHLTTGGGSRNPTIGCVGVLGACTG
jgi:hypothetical protein